MSAFIIHVTKPGDRFDLVAHAAYGDADRTAPIIAANRDLFAPEEPVPAILPQGLSLRVPVLDEADAAGDDDLPPWKRGRPAPAA